MLIISNVLLALAALWFLLMAYMLVAPRVRGVTLRDLAGFVALLASAALVRLIPVIDRLAK